MPIQIPDSPPARPQEKGSVALFAFDDPGKNDKMLTFNGTERRTILGITVGNVQGLTDKKD